MHEPCPHTLLPVLPPRRAAASQVRCRQSQAHSRSALQLFPHITDTSAVLAPCVPVYRPLRKQPLEADIPLACAQMPEPLPAGE